MMDLFGKKIRPVSMEKKLIPKQNNIMQNQITYPPR
jgi:hypothetical protein